MGATVGSFRQAFRRRKFSSLLKNFGASIPSFRPTEAGRKLVRTYAWFHHIVSELAAGRFSMSYIVSPSRPELITAVP